MAAFPFPRFFVPGSEICMELWYMQIFMGPGDPVRGTGVSCRERSSPAILVARIRKVDHVFCSHCALFSLR